MTNPRELESFVRYLRDRRHRVTAERLALFDEVFSQHGHIDAGELLAAMRQRGLKISRATVYRNLDLLVESGLARKQRLGRSRFLYEHVHSGQRHDHLVCTGCGRVVEFVSPGIAALQAEICRAHGFLPTIYQLQINGRCQLCGAAGEARVETRAPTPSQVETRAPNPSRVETRAPNPSRVGTRAPDPSRVGTRAPDRVGARRHA
jgi:Fur family ferric uptake transcriptional regulator